MSEYSFPLGNAVKRARGKLGLSQGEVADAIGKDSRTVLNIENYKGNPKMEVLYPLIRYLHIDSREIFNPEFQRDSPAIQELRLLIEDCSEEEAARIVPILKSVLFALKESRALSMPMLYYLPKLIILQNNSPYNDFIVWRTIISFDILLQ